MKPIFSGRNVWLYIPLASVVPAFLDAGQMWLEQVLDETPTTDWGSIVFRGVEWIVPRARLRANLHDAAEEDRHAATINAS